MLEAAARVIGLLDYIEQVEKLKTKPAFSIPVDSSFVAYQHELKGLPELQFKLQSDSDDVWLRIPRLLEIAAPELGVSLSPWVTLPKSPDRLPVLKAELVSMSGKREVARHSLADHPDVQELFDWYVANQWTPWAAAELPRRKTIARYNQLFALQQSISSEGAETPLELAWGIGYASWKKEGFATPVKYPLLVQSCEVTLNHLTFDLEVRPREVDARLEADCYAEMELPGVRQLDAFWKSSLASGANRINPFEASTFDGVLKAAVGYLDPTGAYEFRTDDVTPPTPGDKLKVTSTWVVFGRRRSGDIFLEDIRRLKQSVEAAPSMPSVIRSFVEHGNGDVDVRAEQAFRGLGSSDCASGAFELYFPMAYNDEQVSIVQKLEHNDGVVVQGPPGTGKTHTIANVICHYLAQGKRVLVTAKGESALAVLQDKLPERIRPLSVALLSDERDGIKQFEHSIQSIASGVASLNPTRTEAAIATAEDKLNRLHGKIAEIDRTVAEFAGRHMRSYAFQGKEVSPEQMAKEVLEHAEEHEWFDDEPPPVKDGQMPVDEAVIGALRKARISIGSDLTYLHCSLPSPDAFPAWPELLALHRDLVLARSIQANVAEGAILQLLDSRHETFEKAQLLVRFLEERAALSMKVQFTQQEWSEGLIAQLADMQYEDRLLTALSAACQAVALLEGERRELLAQAVVVEAGVEASDDFMGAIERLLAGKSPFSLPFGKGEARKALAAVTVLGKRPKDDDKISWLLVQRALQWRVEVSKALARWNAVGKEFGLPPSSGDLEKGIKGVAQVVLRVEEIRDLVFDYDQNLHSRLSEVLGPGAADRMWQGGETFISLALLSLKAHIDSGRLAYAMKRIQALTQVLQSHSGLIVEDLRAFLTGPLGTLGSDEASLEPRWRELMTGLTLLTSKRPAFDMVLGVTSKLAAAGAPKWVARLQSVPAAVDHDPVTPARWHDAWSWRQAVMFLERIDGHQKLRDLFAERKALSTLLARTYQDLVAEKTWLGVFNNSPSLVRQALQAYLVAVHAMGAGTGVRAVRHRKDAREAMKRAYQAVPCWVLPQWRISETLPPDIGLFDLVVIDEASQSDIWALPALLRGKKVLVVGDHKQVSPSAVGVPEEKIKELRERFLVDQPHGAQMTPDKSIYDLAKVVFAGNSVMLKEHFRSVPAIIEFCNKEFYEGDIRPLRLPRANERLDPPLVDVYVKNGFRKGDVNPAEAKAIVDEIEAILADEALAGRSIGVVTLLGMTQAAHIQELVSRRISPRDILARQIAVGPAPVFQGRERDIMLVSMVVGPNDRAAQNRADTRQRFNVALSRARDRMYLFRSVTEQTFKEDTLNSRLIRHFRQPFSQDSRKVEALREKCESGFEFEMFDELVRRGYRVEPQVPCGGYRIDFVVQGDDGRRLAVECDGDRWHGPVQWSDDMSRQRVLERAGWTFWRCFASSFVRNRQTVMSDLLATLGRLGIEPLGAESADNTVWVHSKEVDPFEQLDAVEDDELQEAA